MAKAKDDSAAPKPPALWDIPAGTPPRTCKAIGCGAKLYDVRNEKTGKTMPLAVAPSYVYNGHTVYTRAYSPSTDGGPMADGRGYSHFIDCTNARQFHRDKRAHE